MYLGFLMCDPLFSKEPINGVYGTAFTSLLVKACLFIFGGGKGICPLLDSQRHMQLTMVVVVHVAYLLSSSLPSKLCLTQQIKTCTVYAECKLMILMWDGFS